MPTYEFLLHTTGIEIGFGDEEDGKAVGFYAVRRATGRTEEQALKALQSALLNDAKVDGILNEARTAGLSPRTEIDEVHKVPWWQVLLPWKEPGLAFYENGEEG